MKSSKIRLFFLVFALVTGCNGGGSSSSTDTPTRGRGASPALIAIDVTPSNPSIAMSTSQQFVATGVYADNLTQDLTTAVTWSTSATSVALISNTNGSQGLATAGSTGTATITATLGRTSGSTTATVTSATLQSITVTPSNPSIPPLAGTMQQFTATGTYSDNIAQDLTTQVTWSTSATSVATISNTAGSKGMATSVATGSTTITATLGGTSGSTTLTVASVSATNVLPITVNGSLCSANNSIGYLNKPCVSVTICNPGTSTCQTIDDILLDTGSFGLRIFKSILNPNISLTQITSGSGSLAECVQFGDNSSDWGPVQIADVTLGSETARSVPIQIIDYNFGTAPSTCGTADKSPVDAGFNGLLGVGVFSQDCGSECANSANNGMYYSCSVSACTGTTVPVTSQVQNPVALLPTDNNGVIVKLPSVPPDGATLVNGSLVLGIGTEPNNNVTSGVATYAADQNGEISTNLNGLLYGSYIDSGSDGLFFPTPSLSLLPDCAAPDSMWFCPSYPTGFSATNTGASGSPSDVVSVEIENMESLTSSSNNVFADIGGAIPGQFDWGLPFFLGRNIYVGIDGKVSSLGTGPYWAY